MNTKDYDKFLTGLREEWPETTLPEIRRRLGLLDHKLIVIDDDPTGSQLVKDVAVLTEWGVDILIRELQSPLTAFYISTNSRGKTPEEAEAINYEIGKNLRIASGNANKQISVISRGDSTLRGHFPGEMEALQRGLELQPDGTFLLPALLQDGRLTIDDIHYVVKDGWLVPVGQTDYAKDATFGYSSSNLREWVEEKTQGRVKKDEVFSISLNDLRGEGPDFILTKILSFPKDFTCIVNAVSRKDIEVFTLAMLQAELSGRQYMTRSGPSFVPVRMGLEEYPLMRRKDLPGLDQPTGGLIIVGSYVANTSRQIEEVLRTSLVTPIEMEVDRIIDEKSREVTINAIADEIDHELSRGQDVMLYTSRKLIVGGDAISSLQIGQKVSASLIQVLKRINVRPRYVLAKGGITSSDLATQGLGVKRAMILGQIDKGISVWSLGPETRFDGLYYLVFPGNVGNADTLAKVITELTR